MSIFVIVFFFIGSLTLSNSCILPYVYLIQYLQNFYKITKILVLPYWNYHQLSYSI